MSWTCSRCEVVNRFLPGYPQPDLPNGWASVNESLLCLRCRQEQAVEAGIAEAERSERKITPAAARRAALIDFELRRDPSRSDREIARGLATTANRVTVHRRELLAAGEIERQASGPKRRAKRRASRPKPRPPHPETLRRRALREAAIAELHRDPSRPDTKLAKLLGASGSTVGTIRRELEEAGEIPHVERRGTQRRRSAG
jgi:hypothetical protein